MKRLVVHAFLVMALLALAGCATMHQGVQTPDGQVRQIYSLKPPLCYNAMPLTPLKGHREVAGFRITISADFIARNGFLKISGEVVRATTFPALLIEGKRGRWAWVSMELESLFRATVLVPGIKAQNQTAQIYVFARGQMIEVSGAGTINLSFRNGEGWKRLIEFTQSRFQMDNVIDEWIATTLPPASFRHQLVKTNAVRKVVDTLPPFSPAMLAIPPALPIYLQVYAANWAIGQGIDAVNSDGDPTPQEIREMLEKDPANPEEMEQIKEALKRLEKETRS